MKKEKKSDNDRNPIRELYESKLKAINEKRIKCYLVTYVNLALCILVNLFSPESSFLAIGCSFGVIAIALMIMAIIISRKKEKKYQKMLLELDVKN